jgi:dephospho-CoA kinase
MSGRRQRLPCGVLRVGLTGGIGSGKSTVAAGLVRRGALVVDADQLARRVVEPGGPAYGPLIERFGPEILQPDGTLDRPKLASIAFADPGALADLNGITHPAIAAAVDEQLDTLAAARPGAVAILDHPLLTPQRVIDHHLVAVVVVDTPTETAVARLMQHRGFQEADARARVAAQISREERLAFADVVIDNTGDIDDLDRQLDGVWAELSRRAGAAGT